MTPPKPPENRRPYQRHGLYALQGALKAVSDREGWMESLGEVGEALKAWRADLVADLGGEGAISSQERAVVELATRTYLLLESIDRWLLEQPSLVNKSRRQLFPVVLQRQQLADALARYMAQLGLKRRVKPALDLQTYLAQRAAAKSAQEPKDDGGQASQDDPGSEKDAPPEPEDEGSS